MTSSGDESESDVYSSDGEETLPHLTVQQLGKISNKTLGEEDYLDVITAVSKLSKKWAELCVALGLPLQQISAIRRETAGRGRESLHEGITRWLQGKYDPSWRKLVAAVDRINEHKLAMKILSKHKIKEDRVRTRQGEKKEKPASGIKLTDKELAQVSTQSLREDNFSTVFDAVYQLASSWSKFCQGLGLSEQTITSIKEKRGGDKILCLRDGLYYWLQGKGEGDSPTWKQLVKAVDNTSDEGSHEIAKKLAEEHKVTRRRAITEDVGYFVDLGLGRGVNATDEKPWLNRRTFQVRQVTKSNIIGTEEGDLLKGFVNEVESTQLLQANLRASVPASDVVKIGIDSELSRKVSESQKSVGEKIITRTISFAANVDDDDCDNVESESENNKKDSEESYNYSFESLLVRWIDKKKQEADKYDEEGIRYETYYPEYEQENDDTLTEKEIVEYCSEFIEEYSITHYVHSLELGASYYFTLSEKEFETKVKSKISATGQGAGAAITTEGGLKKKRLQEEVTVIGRMTPLSKDVKEATGGSASQDWTVVRGTTDEAVVGVKLKPISSLVQKNLKLREVLQHAVQKYIDDHQKVKFGPFLISCNREHLFLKVSDEDSTVEATDNDEDASHFYIVRLDEDRYFSIVHEVTHESDPKLKKKIEEECGTHKPAILLYLSVPVNWRGRSHIKKPLQMKMSGKRFLTQMALQSRKSKHFQPEKLADWISGKEIFFIHCSKNTTSGSRTKGSYLCIYKNEKFDANSAEEEITVSSKRVVSTEVSHATEEITSQSNSSKKPVSQAVPKQPHYCIRSEPNIKKHDDPNTFMLFRLLKPEKKLDSDKEKDVSFDSDYEIPKFPAIQKKHKKVKPKDVSLCELGMYTEKVEILLMDESSLLFGRFYEAIIHIMKGLTNNWDIHEQVKEDSDPIGFSTEEFGSFYFGEIGTFKVACWIPNDPDTDKIKKVLQYFKATKCVVSVGLAAAFDSACKRGDIIISDCIDGVKTVETDYRSKSKTKKCLFRPEETRFTPVSRELTSIFNSEWDGIMCTKQRQRKSKVMVGTVMASQHENFEELCKMDLSRNQKTYLGVVPGGVSLLEAVNESSEQDANECNKHIITIHGVIMYPNELENFICAFKWLPTAANSVAQFLKFKLENTSKSYPLFSDTACDSDHNEEKSHITEDGKSSKDVTDGDEQAANSKDKRRKQQRVGSFYTKEEVHIFTDLGLGRGVDATNPKPWINRSSFQVRQATRRNVVGTEEGNLYRSFHNEVESSLHLQTSLSASIPVNQLVSISVDGELSRNYSTSQKSAGTKVVTRTISFLTGFEEFEDDQGGSTTTNAIFENRLLKWIWNEKGLGYDEDGSHLELIYLILEEDDELKQYCYRFIKTSSITHYVHSLELGASYYQVTSDNTHETKVSQKTKVSAGQIATVSGGIESVFGGRRFHKKHTRIGHMSSVSLVSEEQLNAEHTNSNSLLRLQTPTVERNTRDEAVVGVKVEPISSLVKNPRLKKVLQEALKAYIDDQQNIKFGPFYILCGKGDDTICLTVDEESGDLLASPFIDKQTADKEYLEGQDSLATHEPTSDKEFSEAQASSDIDKPRKPVINKFYIVRCDECSDGFNITCDAPAVNWKFEDLPKISWYLTTSVNWRGQTLKNKQPTMVMSGKAEKARMALRSRKSKHFQPAKLTEWISEKEVFFINCQEPTAKRGIKRASYLCVKKIKDGSLIVGCEPDIKRHDDSHIFMLFRLLKLNPKKNETQTADATFKVEDSMGIEINKSLHLKALLKVPKNGEGCPEFVKLFLDDHLMKYLQKNVQVIHDFEEEPRIEVRRKSDDNLTWRPSRKYFWERPKDWIKITDIPADSTDQPVDSPENPIVKWLAEHDIKKLSVILSECKKQAKEDKEQDNDHEEKPEDDAEKENESHETQVEVHPQQPDEESSSENKKSTDVKQSEDDTEQENDVHEIQVEVHPQPPHDESSQENIVSTAHISMSSSTNSESMQRQNEATQEKQSEDDTESSGNQENNKPSTKIKPKETEEGGRDESSQPRKVNEHELHEQQPKDPPNGQPAEDGIDKLS